MITLPPDPSSIVESLRSIGYTMETAVADIIDNSITANADKIDIDISEDKSKLYILDNGDGMDEQTLHEAMKLGGKGPKSERDENDLGRFGLGLKTASFSQCRKLSVISKTKNGIYQRCWDLDKIEENSDWVIDDAIDDKLVKMLDQYETGTLVVWDKIDTIFLKSKKNNDALLMNKLSDLKDHLSLTFHRFISDGRLSINICGGRVDAWDPFLPDVPDSQKIFGQRETLGNGVEIEYVILPNRSYFTDATYRKAGYTKGWTQMQGFYIYRNDRLLATPGWMGLRENGKIMKQERFYDTARICIDITNEQDSNWSIDVMKSKCTPPEYLQEDILPNYAKKVRHDAYVASKRAGVVNTVKRSNIQVIPLWTTDIQNNKLKVKINRDYPFIKDFVDGLDEEQTKRLNKLLTLLSETLPTERISFELGGNNATIQSEPFEDSQEEFDEFTEDLISCYMKSDPSMTREEAIEQVNIILGK